jgi:hypothetical protein
MNNAFNAIVCKNIKIIKECKEITVNLKNDRKIEIYYNNNCIFGKYQAYILDSSIFYIKFFTNNRKFNNKTLYFLLNNNKVFSDIENFEGELEFLYV